MAIDIYDGKVIRQIEDVVIRADVDLSWSRRFCSSLVNRRSSVFGYGWISVFETQLSRTERGYELLLPSGSVELFVEQVEAVVLQGTIRNFGSFRELYRADNQFVVQEWNVNTGDVIRYYFEEGDATSAMLLSSIEDVTGRGLTISRDSQSRIAAIRLQVEKTQLSLQYNRDALLDCVRLDDRIVATYAYDGQYRLAVATDALGASDRYEYTENGRLSREIGKDGSVFTYTYDELGRCTRYSGLDGYDEKRLRFFDATRTTEVTDSRGGKTIYSFRDDGQAVSNVNAIGEMLNTEYDEFGRIISVTDSRDAITQFHYDDFGNRDAVIDPLGNRYSIQYNGAHLAVRLTDPLGYLWLREYDLKNRLIATVDPLGNRTTLTYDLSGNLITIAKPSGGEMQIRYSTENELIGASDWVGGVTQYSWDVAGNLISKISPLGEIARYSYDLLGRLTEVIHPDGSESRFTYDVASNLTEVLDAMGSVTRYRYGTCGRMLATTDRDGNVVQYRWGSEPDQLQQVINAKGEIYELEYDLAGNIVTEKSFAGIVRNFRYDSTGKLIEITNNTAERLKFVRDLAGQLIKQLLPEGSVVEFAYDRCGRIVEANTLDLKLEMLRDPVGRITREIQGDHVVNYEYDGDGGIVSLGTSLGQDFDFELNFNSQLKRLSLNEREIATFNYDGNGHEINCSLRGGASISHTFDVSMRLVFQQIFKAPQWGAVPIQSREFKYNRNGALTEQTRSGLEPTRYFYTAAERIHNTIHDQDAVRNYTYDVNGNLTEVIGESGLAKSIIHAQGNQSIRASEVEYAYDGNGRLSSKTTHVDGKLSEWKFFWDGLDQLRSVINPSGQTWTYHYDAFGRRVRKINLNLDEQIEFIWDRNVILSEVYSGKEPITWLFRGFKPLCKFESSEVYWCINDHLGTPQELIDRSGNVVWKREFDIWGVEQVTSSFAVDCPVRFPGQWLDQETGFHYNRFRYYNPDTASYTSEDPIRLYAGTNHYYYVVNPVNWIDPFGLANEHEVGTFGQLARDDRSPSGSVNRGDKLEAHEFIRHENLAQQGIAGNSRMSGNPSIALTEAQHDAVHAEESRIRAKMNMGPNDFKDLKTELKIMRQAMKNAGVPKDQIKKLEKAAKKFAAQKGCK